MTKPKRFLNTTTAVAVGIALLAATAFHPAWAVNTSVLKNNQRITGNLTVDGTSTLTGAVTQSGNLSVGGNLAVTGTTTLTGVATFTAKPTLSTATIGANGDTITIQDLGNANIVQSEGAQTINGVKTFGSTPVLSTAALTANGDTITIQDLGNANLVQSEGAQTVNGVKTFGSSPVVPDGSFARVKLATDAAAIHSIDLQTALRNDDGTVMDATGGAGLFAIVNGTHAAPGLKLTGETANNNTKTDYASMVFVVPPNYVAASNLSIEVTVDLEGAGTAGTNTIDVEAFELDDSGAVGSDICATAAQDLAASPTARVFTITGTGLVPGDKVLIYYTMVVQETASSNLNGAINDITVKADIKG